MKQTITLMVILLTISGYAQRSERPKGWQLLKRHRWNKELRQSIPTFEEYLAEKPSDCYNCCPYQYHYAREYEDAITDGQFDIDHVNKIFWIHKDDQHSTPLPLLNVIKNLYNGGVVTVYNYNTLATFAVFKTKKDTMQYDSGTGVYTFQIESIFTQMNMSQEGDYCFWVDYSEPTDSLAKKIYADSLHNAAVEQIAVHTTGTVPGFPITGAVELAPTISGTGAVMPAERGVMLQGEDGGKLGWVICEGDKIMIVKYDPFTSAATQIVMTDSTLQMGSTHPFFQGIVYDADYSANAGNRTVMDREYYEQWQGSGAPVSPPDHTDRGYFDFLNNKYYIGICCPLAWLLLN